MDINEFNELYVESVGAMELTELAGSNRGVSAENAELKQKIQKLESQMTELIERVRKFTLVA